MSDDTYATRLSDEAASALEAYAEDKGGWTNYRATRELLEDGLEANGFLDGTDSTLAKFAAEGMRFGAYSAAVLVGLDLTTGFTLVTPAMALLVAALLMAVVSNVEPALTDRVTEFRTNRKALADGGETE